MTKIKSVENRVRHNAGKAYYHTFPTFDDETVEEIITQDRLSFEEATTQVLDDYFKGLIAIPDPQATKESIKQAIRSIYQDNH